MTKAKEQAMGAICDVDPNDIFDILKKNQKGH